VARCRSDSIVSADLFFIASSDYPFIIAFLMQEMLWQGYSQKQENNCKDNKEDNKPFSNRPCYPANKSKNHKYYGNNDEQYPKR
jgi:hypothetical protein